MTAVRVVIGNSGAGSENLWDAFAKVAAEEGFQSTGLGIYKIGSPPDDQTVACRDGLASAFIKKGIEKFLEQGFLQSTGSGMRVMPLDIKIEHI